MLRTVLTVLIIGFGIMALVGILTTIDALKAKINNDFSRMGVNTFTLRVPSNHNDQRSGKKDKVYPPIDFREAMRFKELYSYPAKVSVSANASFMATAKYGSLKTNPNIRIVGGDDNYMDISGYELEVGRNFSKNELETGSNVAIVGSDVLKKLELEPLQAQNEFITIGAEKYKVVGTLLSKGSTLGMSSDNQVIVPLLNVKLNMANQWTRYMVSVTTPSPELLDTSKR